jgi:hypothetical protein
VFELVKADFHVFWISKIGVAKVYEILKDCSLFPSCQVYYACPVYKANSKVVGICLDAQHPVTWTRILSFLNAYFKTCAGKLMFVSS